MKNFLAKYEFLTAFYEFFPGIMNYLLPGIMELFKTRNVPSPSLFIGKAASVEK